MKRDFKPDTLLLVGILTRVDKSTVLILEVLAFLEISQWEDQEVALFTDIVMLTIKKEWAINKQKFFASMLFL